MPNFILVGKEVLLVWIKSALIMSFPARTVNNTPLKIYFLAPSDLLSRFYVVDNLELAQRDVTY